MTSWCDDCDPIEATVFEEDEAGAVVSSLCFRCKRRRDAGLSSVREQAVETAEKARTVFTHLPGYHNAELPR
jgi:hypothetical protein